MFTTIIIDNTTKITPLLKQECVTIKLFGLSTKILATDIAILFIGLVATMILAELLANYMVTNIEAAISESNKKKNQTQKQKIIQCDSIQCDRCKQMKNNTEIKKSKIFGDMFKNYCANCYDSRSRSRMRQSRMIESRMRKSYSDSKFNYNYTFSNN
jgi:hypothetical protein